MTHGRQLLKTWLLRPSTSLLVIKARHDAVECFCVSENVVTATAMHNHLKGFKHIPRIMSKLKSDKVTPNDWKNLVKVSSRCHALADKCENLYSLRSMQQCFETL